MGTGQAIILVVEDDPLVREVIVPELELAGYAVIAAHDGQAALTLLQDGQHFDLLFTDVRMPLLSGWDLAEQARALRPGLPVIYATGYSDEDRRHVPGSILLMKPYRPSHVVQAAVTLGVTPQPRSS